MPSLIYAHMTWTTRLRAPLITASVADFLEGFLRAQAARFSVHVLAIGMVTDHVHVLLHMPAGCDVSKLAQYLKGASARVANRDGITEPGLPLRWARGYDFRSVSPQALPSVERYLREQATRHPLDRIS